MEITGVQPFGARSLGGVQATVSDSTQSGNRGSPAASDRDSTPTIPRAVYAEVVVFPRDGKPLDERPVHQRLARAAARYRRDGGNPRRREPQG